MENRSELPVALDALIECGEKLAQAGRALKDLCTATGSFPAGNSKETQPDAKTSEKEDSFSGKQSKKASDKKAADQEASAEDAHHYSKEDVRKILAGKASEANGRYKAQVKALVRKYSGSGSLSDVPEDSYPALVEETEGFIDG